MDATLIILAGLIVFLSQLVKGFTGFGSGMFAMPFLLWFFDIKFALAFTILLDLASGSMMLSKERKEAKKEVLTTVIAGLLLGAIIGGLLLPKIDSIVLKRLFGAVIVLMSAHMLIESKTTAGIIRKRLWGTITGTIAGLTGVLFGVNGPPIVYFANQTCNDKTQLRATLYAIFLADSALRTVTYLATGIINLEIVTFAAMMLPFTILGILAGNRIHHKTDEKTYKKTITILILIAGITTILK